MDLTLPAEASVVRYLKHVYYWYLQNCSLDYLSTYNVKDNTFLSVVDYQWWQKRTNKKE